MLGSADVSGLTSASVPDKYADFIVTAISTTINKAIPKSESMRSGSNPISDETLVPIKEKRNLRRQYSQNKDPRGWTCIFTNRISRVFFLGFEFGKSVFFSVLVIAAVFFGVVK